MSYKINDYYDLANILENDIRKVALLVSISRLTVNKKIIEDLQSLKVDVYNCDINRILELPINFIKAISSFLNENIKNQEFVNMINIGEAYEIYEKNMIKNKKRDYPKNRAKSSKCVQSKLMISDDGDEIVLNEFQNDLIIGKY